MKVISWIKKIWKGFWEFWDILWPLGLAALAIVGWLSASTQTDKLVWLVILLAASIIFKLDTILKEVKATQHIHLHLNSLEQEEIRNALNRS